MLFLVICMDVTQTIGNHRLGIEKEFPFQYLWNNEGQSSRIQLLPHEVDEKKREEEAKGKFYMMCI